MQKEIARLLVQTPWFQNQLKEPWFRNMAEDWTVNSFRQGLKPEGKPRFDEFINSLQKGEQISLSDFRDMFMGFDITSGIKGLDSLTHLKDKQILLVSNHTNYGPLKGGWQHIVINSYVKQMTGQEIRWLHGFDPTTTQNLFRERIRQSTNNIPVRDGDPIRTRYILIQAIRSNKDSIGLYPEGDGSKNLIKAAPNAGRLILLCSKNIVDIVSCSVGYQNDTFSLTFDTLDKSKIIRVERNVNNKPSAWEMIADYAMARIAQNLQENRRGYYHNPEGFIAGFDELAK